jgi:hypothetical protein
MHPKQTETRPVQLEQCRRGWTQTKRGLDYGRSRHPDPVADDGITLEVEGAKLLARPADALIDGCRNALITSTNLNKFREHEGFCAAISSRAL